MHAYRRFTLKVHANRAEIEILLQSLRLFDAPLHECDDKGFPGWSDAKEWRIEDGYNSYRCGNTKIDSKMDKKEYAWIVSLFIAKKGENDHLYYLVLRQFYDSI
jgi:hypothetical protein